MRGHLLLAVPVLVAALVGIPATAALADDPGGGVVVTPVDPGDVVNPPKVGVQVRTPGTPGRPGASTAPASSRSGSGGSAPVCSYTPEPGLEPSMRAVGYGAPPPDAHLYSVTCGGVSAWFFWLNPAAVPVPAGGPSAAVLAQRAYRVLVLATPVIGMSPGPGVAQLVRVPTWLWLDPAMWGPRSASASVPGLSATVTAVPVRVVWSMGDGTTVVCAGPGTRFVAGRSNPYAASPDCGHTYTRAGPVTVTATVSWRVRWAGGGTAGVLPGLVSASSVDLRVVEAQAVNR
jgi:hypothetical protein